MKRREFIGFAATGAACTFCPAIVSGSDLNSISILANPRLLGVLRHERVLHVLGERYREITPREDNVHALVEALMADVKPEGAIYPESPLVSRVNEQVRRDFAAGRTVTLNGWILSLTEARQCALHSLVTS
jgi:hypothetical protein